MPPPPTPRAAAEPPPPFSPSVSSSSSSSSSRRSLTGALAAVSRVLKPPRHRRDPSRRRAHSAHDATDPARGRGGLDLAQDLAQLRRNVRAMLSTRWEIAYLDDATLLNRRGRAAMQLRSLEELNRGVADLLAAEALPPPERRELRHEVRRREGDIEDVRRVLRLLDAEIGKRGLPLAPPSEVVVVPEDPDLCQYCFTQTADAEFQCCGHDGACGDCVRAMAAAGPRCPHCRASDPVVNVGTLAAHLTRFRPGPG